ncbi:PMT family glycosyltransferase [Bifidobacterium parmae]|uniref:PMT family glycosyltransferase n=2 Tax=Bifidobacterium parmae TaxID=361854 RepID=A0A2N5J5T5_9BIFI|nr:hypothetical protein [Bifidobacterium parmae]PLS29566.1 PMT family glycosyltransferase [Bifidobacterium parmae]
MLVVLAVECVGFNLPFWRTLGASTDSAAAANTLGPGLGRTDTGALRVTDPTGSWLEVKADGTSDYLRVDTSQPKQDALRVIHLRVASPDGGDGTARTVAASSPRSHFLKAHSAGVTRVWVEEAKGSVIPIEAVRANVRVPFSFSPARVALMLGALLLAALWRPGSRLWRVALDPSDLRQRFAFAGLVAPFAVATAANVIWQMRYATPLSFHQPGGYTYDIDQYGHLADALLHGRLSLDLIVPDALAAAPDPYDVTTRSRLLAEGVSPIYWDYAYYDGHWYSYFGVVPAAILFAPYRLLTGRMLSSAATVHLFMLVALVFAWLLTIRLVVRLAPRTSLAATSMMLLFVPLAANMPYLAYRTNFYSVPFAASLAFTTAGLWLWLGAATLKRPLNPADRWHMDGAPALSLPRLGLGAFLIAANFGCRPTFCLAAVLGIPLFWPQIRAMAANLKAGRVGVARAFAAPAVVLAAALVPLVPLAWYNHARFGSFVEFGNDYQFTVTDMTAFRQPPADIPAMVGYYLALPPRIVHAFPFVALSPTPLARWAFAEPMVGGLLVLCPPLLAALALPFLRRRLRGSGLMPLMTAALTLGLFVVVFDASNAGLGWRYMGDFGWLFAMAALPGLLRAVNGAGDGCAPPAARLKAARIVVLVLLAFSVLVNVLCLFTVGRQDQMVATNPALFHDVMTWFTM